MNSEYNETLVKFLLDLSAQLSMGKEPEERETAYLARAMVKEAISSGPRPNLNSGHLLKLKEWMKPGGLVNLTMPIEYPEIVQWYNKLAAST